MIVTDEVWVAHCDYFKGCKETLRMDTKDLLETMMKMAGWKTNRGKVYCEKHAIRTTTYKLENSEETLVNVHIPYLCDGRTCVIHNLTDHHMRSWPQLWRADRQFMERTCSHGIGHPDPDQWEYLVEKYGKKRAKSEFVHGCDGCCWKEDR